ncbi:RNAseH domain-containing protein [Nostoc commune]|nr:RNAseH domain-containing protein [Nostoc commune]
MWSHCGYGFGHYSDWTALPAPLFFERVVRTILVILP